jgi:hypothetical protein
VQDGLAGYRRERLLVEAYPKRLMGLEPTPFCTAILYGVRFVVDISNEGRCR